MKAATKGLVQAPPVTPTIEPSVTVGDYLDGTAFYEDVLEVLALHVVLSIIRTKEKKLPTLWWLPARHSANG